MSNASVRRSLLKRCESDEDRAVVNRLCRGSENGKSRRDKERMTMFNNRKRAAAQEEIKEESTEEITEANESLELQRDDSPNTVDFHGRVKGLTVETISVRTEGMTDCKRAKSLQGSRIVRSEAHMTQMKDFAVGGAWRGSDLLSNPSVESLSLSFGDSPPHHSENSGVEDVQVSSKWLKVNSANSGVAEVFKQAVAKAKQAGDSESIKNLRQDLWVLMDTQNGVEPGLKEQELKESRFRIAAVEQMIVEAAAAGEDEKDQETRVMRSVVLRVCTDADKDGHSSGEDGREGDDGPSREDADEDEEEEDVFFDALANSPYDPCVEE